MLPDHVRGVVWCGVPPPILFLASCEDEVSILEAARIDGAGRGR
jgi:hypothetical protein